MTEGLPWLVATRWCEESGGEGGIVQMQRKVMQREVSRNKGNKEDCR
jgi:hypothetical protein